MEIGKLNRRGALQQLIAGEDALGQPVSTWATVATIWMHVRLLSGIETIKSDAPVSTVKASIRIRHRAGVTSDMRVLLDGVAYTVTAVMPDVANRRYVDLACEIRNGS